MRKLLLLFCFAVQGLGVFASDPAAERAWITVGSDAVGAIQAEFEERLWTATTRTHLTNPDVTLMRVTEEQKIVISRLMHEKFNRCSGFVAHKSLEMAIATGQRATSFVSKRAPLSYTLDRSVEVNTVLGSVTDQNIEDTILALSTNYTTRYYTTQEAVDSANWLKAQWEAMAVGRSDISVDLYTHSWAMPSVIMTITGAHQPQDIVVMGAHLDSTSSTSSAPGADDDASGIACLTEIARAALANGYVPARTIKIIGYAGEEAGLLGSGDIASAHQSSGANVIGVLQLDMTNYNGSAQDIWLMTDYTNAAQNNFIGNLVDTYTTATWNTSSCGYGCSDHASWHNQGYAASMPFEAKFGEHNQAIHSPNDTYATSGGTVNHSSKFAQMGVGYMIEMGKGGLNNDPGADPGPVDTGGPQATELFNPETRSSLSGTTGGEDHYFIDVPAGATNLQISISGGSGDCDLYTRYGSAPTSGTWDCRPYAGGNSESCPTATPTAGKYYIMLYAYNSYSGLTLSVSYDGPAGNSPPTAGFSSATNALTANFTDSSTDSDGTVTAWAWTFGDGGSSSAQNPSHSYASAGTYTVGLTVTDNDGATDSTSQSVTVTSGNAAPGASFTASSTDLTASFTDTSSDSDGTLVSWLWTFGEGGSSTAQNPNYTYGSAGTYVVNLTVTDNDGATDTTSQNITVIAPNSAPTSSFTSSTTNLTATFTDTSSDSDGSVVGWSWTFGDGASSSSQNPSHTYASAGTYTVNLTVTDDDGATHATSGSVTVTSGGGWVQLSSTDFETGMGGYTDGGTDCRRSANDSAFAHQGTYCVRLRDDTGITSSFYSTNNINLSGYSDLQVSFWYMAVSMENNEDFFLEFFDGATWQIIGTWASGTDFTNGNFYNPTVTINSGSYSFGSTNKIRIRCDASGNGDRIYIDELTVSAQ